MPNKDVHILLLNNFYVFPSNCKCRLKGPVKGEKRLLFCDRKISFHTEFIEAQVRFF